MMTSQYGAMECCAAKPRNQTETNRLEDVSREQVRCVVFVKKGKRRYNMKNANQKIRNTPDETSQYKVKCLLKLYKIQTRSDFPELECVAFLSLLCKCLVVP